MHPCVHASVHRCIHPHVHPSIHLTSRHHPPRLEQRLNISDPQPVCIACMFYALSALAWVLGRTSQQSPERWRASDFSAPGVDSCALSLPTGAGPAATRRRPPLQGSPSSHLETPEDLRRTPLTRGSAALPEKTHQSHQAHGYSKKTTHLYIWVAEMEDDDIEVAVRYRGKRAHARARERERASVCSPARAREHVCVRVSGCARCCVQGTGRTRDSRYAGSGSRFERGSVRQHIAGVLSAR